MCVLSVSEFFLCFTFFGSALIFVLSFQSHENFYQVAEERLSHLIKSEGLSSISSPALQTRTPASTTDRRQETKTSVSLCICSEIWFSLFNTSNFITTSY